MQRQVSKNLEFTVDPGPNGSLKISVHINDVRDKFNRAAWIGKTGTFSVKRMCTVKDSRPVHKEITLFKSEFIAKSGKQTFTIPKNKLASTVGNFPYDGSKIKVETRAEVKFKKLLGFGPTFHRGICGDLPDTLPHRAKVKNNAKELIDPKDTFNFFKNFISISGSDQVQTLLVLIVGLSSAGGNLFVGFHDQMAPEHLTMFYSHRGSDGDSQSPLLNALGISGLILALSWFQVKKQLRKYMTFHFKRKLKRTRIDRESSILVSDMVTGISGVALYDATLRVVACNMEKGQYIRGYGSNQRTISFSNPSRAVLLYSKKVPMIEKGQTIDSYFRDTVSFKPMFEALYPKQMVGSVHGLDLVWEIQLLVDDLVDQELIGDSERFVMKDFYSA